MSINRIPNCVTRAARRHFRGRRRLLPGLALPLLLASACATTSPPKARSWLDEKTGVTITAQEPVAVFARDEQMRAMNVRDYAGIGAVEVNRRGDRRHYLVIASWSTIDRTAAERELTERAFASATLWADDRPVVLQRATTDRTAIGLRQRPYAQPTPGALESWYPVTLNEIQSLATAGVLKLAARGADEELRYEEWRNSKIGFAHFLEYLAQPP